MQCASVATAGLEWNEKGCRRQPGGGASGSEQQRHGERQRTLLLVARSSSSGQSECKKQFPATGPMTGQK